MLHAQKISCQVRIRPGESKSTYGQIGSVYIQVVVESLPDRIPIGISWPVQYFDLVKERLLPRFENDEECYQNNLLISAEMGKANRLSIELYVASISITAKEFKKRFKRFASREDILDYIIARRDELYNLGEIAKGTYVKYLTVIHRLQEYQSGGKVEYSAKDLWKFNTIGYNQIKGFEIWMYDKKGLAHNTMAGTMKIIHKFLSCARKDGIVFDDPMKDYKVPRFSDGVRDALDLDELKALKRFYQNGTFTPHEKDVLDRYLISCFTGLRKSDIEQLDTRIHIRNKRLCLKMLKTRRYDKMVEFKLPSFVLEIIGNRRGRIFLPMESALLNKTLRRLIAQVKNVEQEPAINKYVKFHSGRDTFATNFLRLGGMLIVLKDILGHSSIKMTEIYLKMSNDDSDKTMDAFDKL